MIQRLTNCSSIKMEVSKYDTMVLLTGGTTDTKLYRVFEQLDNSWMNSAHLIHPFLRLTVLFVHKLYHINLLVTRSQTSWIVDANELSLGDAADAT
jgi:hypothetical protein